jgi:hypothetical protein
MNMVAEKKELLVDVFNCVRACLVWVEASIQNCHDLFFFFHTLVNLLFPFPTGLTGLVLFQPSTALIVRLLRVEV